MGVSISVQVLRDGQAIGDFSFDSDHHRTIKIGRLTSAQIKLEDPKVSRIHAVIEFSGVDASLIDLGSTQGTVVNGQQGHQSQIESRRSASLWAIPHSWSAFQGQADLMSRSSAAAADPHRQRGDQGVCKMTATPSAVAALRGAQAQSLRCPARHARLLRARPGNWDVAAPTGAAARAPHFDPGLAIKMGVGQLQRLTSERLACRHSRERRTPAYHRKIPCHA